MVLPGVNQTPQDDSQSDSTVTLHVVSPGIEGQKLTLPATTVTTTIAQLKLKIQEALPSRPGPDQQRLIYQGRPLLLPDTTLASIFGPDALRSYDTFTIHMAIRPTGPANSASRTGRASPNTASAARIPVTLDPANAAGVNAGRPPNHYSHGIPGHLSGTPSGEGPRMAFEAGQGGFPIAGHLPGNAGVPTGPQIPTLDQIQRQMLSSPGIMPFTNGLDAHFHNQHILQQHQQHQREQQLNNLLASQQRMRAENPERTAIPTESADSSHDPSHPAEETQQAANGGGQGTQPGLPQHQGPTSRSFVQDGHGPAGSWRISVEQTTVHTPMPTSSAFTAPSASPMTSALANGNTINFPPNQTGIRWPFQTPGPRIHLGPTYPITLPSRNTAFTDPSAFPPQLYLITSPAGYQAMLIPPQGPVSVSPHFNLPAPTPTRTVSPTQQQTPANNEAARGPAQPGDTPAQQQAQNGQDEQQADGAVDIIRILFPLGGHLWLLIRLLGFVYLLAGGATWTRTILLSSIALLVFVAQAGWLAPLAEAVGAPVRRRVEQVVRVDGDGIDAAMDQLRRRRQQRDREQNQDRDGQARDHRQARNDMQPDGNARDTNPLRRTDQEQDRAPAERNAITAALQHPTAPLQELRVTPEQLAARLLRERDERDQSVIRAALRRLERGLALFVTSLVPGWGEEHVRVQQEQDARRARLEAEAEVARRRDEEQTENGAGASVNDPSSKAEQTPSHTPETATLQGESSQAGGSQGPPE